jgi:hypothetical protein
MAQFGDVFSTTTKVILTLLIIAGVLGVGSLILVKIASIPSGNPDADCERDTACREAKANVQRIESEAKAESEARLLAIKTKIAHVHSDSEGELYVRCTTGERPSKPANQKRCQALINRIDKEIEAGSAADAKAKANW